MGKHDHCPVPTHNKHKHRTRHSPPWDTTTSCIRHESHSKPLHLANNEIIVLAPNTTSRKVFTNGHLRQVNTTTMSVAIDMLGHLPLPIYMNRSQSNRQPSKKAWKHH
ncbi:hypothetical protein BDA96_01G449100 [Sorghum bicolor]|uniref:Uncharacterized protein n=1 Tax=Sorghum bicolor TaxID=4558 RepID=A0A921V3D5_SORBI|nr:hypothetical protein BDA96_01G449100 [Sorghum bicolor]